MTRVDMEFFSSSVQLGSSRVSAAKIGLWQIRLFLHISFLHHLLALYVNYVAFYKLCFTSLKAMSFIFAWMCTLFLREFRFSYIPSLFGNFFASWYHHVLFLPNNLLVFFYKIRFSVPYEFPSSSSAY